MSDVFGDRMKMYEKQVPQRFLPLLPVCARLDGKGFSKFTRGLKRPYDERLSKLMKETTQKLVEETNACIGYTQSDEITLVWYSDSIDSQIFFDGKIQKIVSVLASLCTAYFNAKLPQVIPEKSDRFPVFDCRAWTVPNLDEGANVFLWRELDATKNSVSMACREYFSHKQMMNKGRSAQMDMLHSVGVNWNDYPVFFKRGSYFQRQTVVKGFTSEEIEKLPQKHPAKQDKEFKVERKQVKEVNMPPLAKVINRVGVIFNGENPKVEELCV